jgi:uncharacterized damage-inducible protein DinB
MAKKGKKAAKPRKATKKPARKANGGSASIGLAMKAQFLESLAREHHVTMKVLNAFPVEQSEFRPHPRSQCARELAFTFVMEQQIMSLAFQNQLKMGSGFPKAPSDFRAIVDQFDKDYHALVDVVKKTKENDLNTPVPFFTGPKQVGNWPKMQLAWFMLSDQIHHRGQYTVYLRMAGGKVPSIYGPSADEPWM